MASGKLAYGICDKCGFRYRLRDLKKTSYGSMVCPEDFEKADLKNHPQNKSPNVRDDENITVSRRSPMPPTVVTVTDWLPS